MASTAAAVAAAAAASTAIKTTLKQTAATTATTNVPKSLQGPLFARVQFGLGTIVAQARHDTTRLVTVSHQAPFRWIPLRSSTAARAGAAIVYGSNYGGGLLPGDAYETNVHAQSSARLGLLTQGSNRVYKQLQDRPQAVTSNRPSRITTSFRADADSLLVVAPDPMTPFANSRLEQEQSITLHPQANLCFIDWVAAGRLSQGERWQQASLTSRTRLYFDNQDDNDAGSHGTDQKKQPRPVLVDSVHMNRYCSHPASALGMDWSNHQFNAYATFIVYGDQVQSVKQACQQLQTILASQWTSTRDPEESESFDTRPTEIPLVMRELPSRLAGPVLMGVTSIAAHQGRGDIMVVRLAATANEDLYRVFHTCLAPLASRFGHGFYQERIRGVHSAAVPVWTPVSEKSAAALTTDQEIASKAPVVLPSFPSSTPRAQWAAHLLTDSALPTGGFAYSAGLEAAAQLQMIRTVEDIERFVHTTVASTLQMTTPTLERVHQAVHNETVAESWSDIHDDLHALLISNGPACRASLDQGTSLLRLARQWPAEKPFPALHGVSQGHYAAIFGLVTATWDLSVAECRHLLAFCVARDVISSAVRLNLIGPLASVPLLAKSHQALSPYNAQRTKEASSCAPVLEALQPLHDVLAVRLFRA